MTLSSHDMSDSNGGPSSGRERTRTPYLLSANEALYQVSYAPE